MNDQHEEVNMGCSIWQSQQVEAPRISLEILHHHSGKLRRSMSNRRNMFYIIAAMASVIGFISVFKQWSAGSRSPMSIVLDISTLLFIPAIVCMAFYLREHLHMKQIERDSDVLGGLAVYRSELERLIALADREWRVLLYLVPGYLTLLVGGLIFDQRPGKIWRYGLTVVAWVVIICFSFWVGRKKSRCLQCALDAVASLK